VRLVLLLMLLGFVRLLLLCRKPVQSKEYVLPKDGEFRPNDSHVASYYGV
jgi:hypothetical protein